MTRLGFIYNNALGVERDPKEAAKWWRKAAQLGDADGQAMLGATFYLGAGVKRDLTAALTWLSRAQAAHSEFADKFFTAVYQQCTPDERAEAARRAALPLGPDDEAAP
jgi:TPR repeat protein